MLGGAALGRGTFSALIFAVLASGCDQQVCHLIGCASEEVFEIGLPFATAELESAEVSGCRNDACWRGPLSGLDVDWSVYAYKGIPLEPETGAEPPGVHAVASVTQESDGSLSLSFTWGIDDYRDVRRGDRLGLAIRDAVGTEMMTIEEDVTGYQDDYPNGQECDETPCRTARVDRRGL